MDQTFEMEVFHFSPRLGNSGVVATAVVAFPAIVLLASFAVFLFQRDWPVHQPHVQVSHVEVT
jgi:hypothetical protein